MVHAQPGASEIFSDEEPKGLSTFSSKEATKHSTADIVEGLKKIEIEDSLAEEGLLRGLIQSDAPLWTIKLATVFAFKVLAKMSESIHFGNMINSLRPLYEFHAPAAVWLIKYLSENERIFAYMLVMSMSTDIRESFCNLMKTAIRVCFFAEAGLFGKFHQLPELQANDVVGVRL